MHGTAPLSWQMYATMQPALRSSRPAQTHSLLTTPLVSAADNGGKLHRRFPFCLLDVKPFLLCSHQDTRDLVQVHNTKTAVLNGVDAIFDSIRTRETFQCQAECADLQEHLKRPSDWQKRHLLQPCFR